MKHRAESHWRTHSKRHVDKIANRKSKIENPLWGYGAMAAYQAFNLETGDRNPLALIKIFDF